MIWVGSRNALIDHAGSSPFLVRIFTKKSPASRSFGAGFSGGISSIVALRFYSIALTLGACSSAHSTSVR